MDKATIQAVLELLEKRLRSLREEEETAWSDHDHVGANMYDNRAGAIVNAIFDIAAMLKEIDDAE
jgi:hypothetical protein